MDLNELLSRHQRSLLMAAGDFSTPTRQSALRQADDFARAIKDGRTASPHHPIVLSGKTLLELLGDTPAGRTPSGLVRKAGAQED